MRKFYKVPVKVKAISSDAVDEFLLTGVCDNPIEGPLVLSHSESGFVSGDLIYPIPAYVCEQLMRNTETRDMVLEAVADNYNNEDGI